MYVTVVQPPTELPLSLSELRAQCRLSVEDPTDEDAIMMSYLRAAVKWIDGPDGWLGRCLITQTLQITADCFPSGQEGINLPCVPVQSVQSIYYVSEAGVSTLLDSSYYQVVGIGQTAAKVVLGYDKTWPIPRRQPEAVTITYVFGS